MNFEKSFKTFHTVRTIFKPTTIDDLCISHQFKQYLKKFIRNNSFHILFYGSKDTGKTSILNCMLNEYYTDIYDKNEYIMKIQGLCEHSMSILKTDIMSFCMYPTSNKKRTLVVDDIDLLNSNGYDIILKCLNLYKNNINIIITCVDKYKLCDQILSRLILIQCKYDEERFAELYHEQLFKLPFKMEDKKATDIIFKHANYSFRILHSLFDKLIYSGRNVYTVASLISICGIIDVTTFDKYTKSWLNKNLVEANEQLKLFMNKGYTVVDVLELYFVYIKSCDFIPDKIILKVIQAISEYITYFYAIHENPIELFFLTHELIMLT